LRVAVPVGASPLLVHECHAPRLGHLLLASVGLQFAATVRLSLRCVTRACAFVSLLSLAGTSDPALEISNLRRSPEANATGDGTDTLVSSGRRSGGFVHQQCSSHADCKYADSDRAFGEYSGTWDPAADPAGDCNGCLHCGCTACGSQNVCYWWKVRGQH
jgi:hypothetical protein